MTSINTSSIYRITGLASGLDIDQMVSDLMKAQRAPLDKLMQTRQIWQWKQEDYRSINTSLLNLRNIAFNLKLQSSFQVKKAVSSDESIVTATATGSAVPGIYTVNVTQLAEGVSRVSQSSLDDEAGSGGTIKSLKDQFNLSYDTLTFTLDGTNGSKKFTFDTTTDNIYTVVERINAANLGITASYDASLNRFFLTTTTTGSKAMIKVTDDTNCFLSDDSGSGINTLKLKLQNGVSVYGKDASFSFGDATNLYSSTNTVTVAGLTLTFKKIGETSINVSNDIDTVVNTIKDFVNKYNETLAAVNAELKEERYPDYLPLTDEQIQEGKLTDKQIDQWQEKARSGLLKGDPLLSSAVSSIRSAMASIVEGLTGQVTVTSGNKTVSAVANSLSVIGITTGTWEEEGKLYLDENRLREALQSSPDAVMELFTRTTDAAGNTITDTKQKGIAVQLYDSINNAISRITSEAGSAGSLYDQSYISRTIRDLNGQISEMEKRLQDLEDRYYRQFTAMEEAIAQMNSQSMWLSQQLSGGGGK